MRIPGVSEEDSGAYVTFPGTELRSQVRKCEEMETTDRNDAGRSQPIYKELSGAILPVCAFSPATCSDRR